MGEVGVRSEGGAEAALLPGIPEEAMRVDALSLVVIQCRTRTEKRTAECQPESHEDVWDRDALSTLQQIKQIQPGSPLSTMTKVRLTTDEVRVAQDPMKVRRATVRTWEFRLYL